MVPLACLSLLFIKQTDNGSLSHRRHCDRCSMRSLPYRAIENTASRTLAERLDGDANWLSRSKACIPGAWFHE